MGEQRLIRMGAFGEADQRRLCVSEAAARLHRRSIVIDLHVDSIIQQRLFGYDICAPHDPHMRWLSEHQGARPFDLARACLRCLGDHQPFFNHADIPRMRRGGYDCAALTLHYWPTQSERAWREILRQLDYMDQVIDSDPQLARAQHPDDVRRAAKEGKLSFFAAVEGLHCLGAGGKRTETKRLDRIDTLYERGVRYITLTHFRSGDTAPAGFGPWGSQRGGLNAFGRKAIRKMNDLGMMVDVAHVNHQSVLDACRESTKPVMASHSGFVGANPAVTHTRYAHRLITDDGARAIAETGGIVGVFMAPHFLAGKKDTSDCLARHYAYALTLLADISADPASHLAFGSDFDGWLRSIPTDIDDAADLPLLTEALLRSGITEPQIEKIWGESFLDFWQRTLDR